MAHGYVSDVDGNDTVMREPEATVAFDPEQLSQEQAAELASIAGLEQQDAWVIGELFSGEDVRDGMNTITFHFEADEAIQALMAIGAVQAPEQRPNEMEEQVE